MNLLKRLESFDFMQTMTIVSAVLIALVVNSYYAFSHGYWMVLSALMVTQTTRGMPTRQGMLLLMMLVLAVISSSLVTENIRSINIIDVVLSVMFATCVFTAWFAFARSSKPYLYTSLYLMLIMIAIVSSGSSDHAMPGRILDIIIGAMIGMICSGWLLPVKWDQTFKSDTLPILEAMSEYSQVLSNYLFSPMQYAAMMKAKRYQLEDILLDQYPNWVYEVGFNRGLRSGFRYFLIHVEQMIETLFAMEQIAAQPLDPALLNNLYAAITQVMQVNSELLAFLIEYFSNKKHQATTSDYTSDVDELEKVLQQIVPGNLELLDLSPHYLALTALVRDMRDVRHLLLKLVFSLQ